MKIAVIGLGYWGQNLIREFSKIVKISICCSNGNPANKKWLHENYPSIQYTKNYDCILSDPTIDAVVIVTPTSSHFELGSKALEFGKHVFLEKPITKNISQAKKLLDKAKSKKLVLFIGHIFIYHPVLEKLKKIIKNDPIKYLNFYWSKNGTFTEDILYNLGSHEISIILELLNPPTKIKVINNFGFKTNSDIVCLSMDFHRNKKCLIHINRISNLKTKKVHIFTRKNLFLWDNDRLLKFNLKQNSFSSYYKPKNSPLAIECKEFILNLKKKTINYENPQKAINILRVIKKIRRTD